MMLVRIGKKVMNLEELRHAVWIDKGEKVPVGEFTKASDDMLKLYFRGGWQTTVKGDVARGVMAVLCEESRLQFGQDVSLMSETMRPEGTNDFFFPVELNDQS